MECTSDLCVKAGTGIGLGTDSPTSKLSVVGNIGATGSIDSSGNISTSGAITATGDVCGAGACLSQIASFVANQPLVNNVHNQAACTAAGGTVVPSDVSYPQCRFNAASCPSGWSQYKEFAKLDGVFCYGGPSGYSCYGSCTPSSGSWGSPAGAVGGCQVCYGPGVDQYGSGICNCGICTSSVRVQIGCY